MTSEHSAAPSPPDKLDTSAPIVIELARSAIAHLRETAPDWTTAYVRIAREPGSIQCKGSYVTPSQVLLFKAIGSDFLGRMRDTGERLFEALDKDRGVALLVVQSSLDYEIKFDWDDPARWAISRMDGATGVPTDL